jgi:hypothetical protein
MARGRTLVAVSHGSPTRSEAEAIVGVRYHLITQRYFPGFIRVFVYVFRRR